MTYLAELISSVEKKWNCKVRISYSFDKQCTISKNDSVLKIALNQEEELYYLERILLLNIENFKTIRLRPLKQERGLMIDNGRKYYSLKILLRIVDRMAKLGMNYLQLHFSENEGFRIESKKYPQICSNQHLTQTEIKKLILYAEERNISIIPEFDSPGHLQKILSKFQDYRLSLKNSDNEYKIYEKALDINNPNGVKFIESVWGEYLDLFSKSSIIHIGADEFIDFKELLKQLSLEDAQLVYDQYIKYINELSSYIESYGKKIRVWNDGIYRKEFSHNVVLNPKVQITYWTRWDSNMAEIKQILNKGHKVGNFNDNYLYFVLGEAAGYKYPTVERIRNWSPDLFSDNQLVDLDNTQNFGSYFCIWSDVPDALTEQEVYENICPLLGVMQEKLWQLIIE